MNHARMITRLTLAFLPLLLMASCARFPSTPENPDAPPRTLYSQITVRGEINPDYYYFFALGVDQTRATGPVPVVTGPELTNGWGTISGLPPNAPVEQPPFYVQFHNNSFAQFLNGQFIGAPYRAEVSPDGKSLSVEIDQRLLDTLLGANPAPIVQVNWMTMMVITVPPEQIGLGKEYDAFGSSGNSYLDAVPLLTSRQWISGLDGVPDEPAYGIDEHTAPTPDIDMVGWQVEVKLLSTAP